MIGHHPNQIVRTVCILMSPFVMMFGFYVIAHGHYVPGGGFAGGVALAVAVVLLRLVLDAAQVTRRFPANLGLVLGVAGLLLYLAIGAVGLIAGGDFLDYSAVDVAGMEPADVRYLGILAIEVAVGIAVGGTLLVIFDLLIGRDRNDDGRTDHGSAA